MPYTISKQIFFKVCAIRMYDILKSMQLCKMIYTVCKNNLYLYFFLVNFSNHCFVLNNAIISSFLGLLLNYIEFLVSKYKHFFIIRNCIEERNKNEEKLKKGKINIYFHNSETLMNLELNVFLIPSFGQCPRLYSDDAVF